MLPMGSKEAPTQRPSRQRSLRCSPCPRWLHGSFLPKPPRSLSRPQHAVPRPPLLGASRRDSNRHNGRRPSRARDPTRIPTGSLRRPRRGRSSRCGKSLASTPCLPKAWPRRPGQDVAMLGSRTIHSRSSARRRQNRQIRCWKQTAAYSGYCLAMQPENCRRTATRTARLLGLPGTSLS